MYVCTHTLSVHATVPVALLLFLLLHWASSGPTAGCWQEILCCLLSQVLKPSRRDLTDKPLTTVAPSLTTSTCDIHLPIPTRLLVRPNTMRSITCAYLAAGFVAFTTGNTVIEPSAYAFTLRSVHNTSSSLVAVPFGTLGDVKFSEPSLVQTAKSEFDANRFASDESWAKYKVKGGCYSCLLNMSNENAGLETKKDPGTPPSAESVWRGDLQSTSKLCRK